MVSTCKSGDLPSAGCTSLFRMVTRQLTMNIVVLALSLENYLETQEFPLPIVLLVRVHVRQRHDHMTGK